MEKNVVELEKRLTYLEKFIDELNEVVIEQGKTTDLLRKEIVLLRERQHMSSSPLDDSDPLPEEKPPHY